jgi:hypothetical protein
MKILWFLIFIIIELTVIWLIGSFIAMDINPLHWWLFTEASGRIASVLILLLLIAGNVKALTEDY